MEIITGVGLAELGVLTYTKSVPHRPGFFYIFINGLVYYFFNVDSVLRRKQRRASIPGNIPSCNANKTYFQISLDPKNSEYFKQSWVHPLFLIRYKV